MSLIRLVLMSRHGFPFLICLGIGYFLGMALPYGWWSPYASILIAYHVFLGWLFISADHDTGASMSPLSTFITHICCLAVLIGFSKVTYLLPMLRIVRLGSIFLASFEMHWLFSVAKIRVHSDVLETVDSTEVIAKFRAPKEKLVQATGYDYEEWVRERSTEKPTYYKPGMLPAEDFERWLRARGKTQFTASALEASQPAQGATTLPA
jgi:hypothetical protein